ncbi:DoxX family protein [Undibacter mobilis]|uniref:DoxX family protein n=1 Tax=Undibacter mobilis TaxID=2292256 RepID=A0A371B7E4_9BRAD|nr:DoxX family protein [Undibacter mobilis]RDV03464.1 DoxX family protein [Undibacter mobilis]
MSQTLIATPRPTSTALVKRAISLMEAIPYWVVALITRIAIAGVFWQSGQTKVDGFHVTESAIELFRSEYRLPLIDPAVAAHLAALAEHLFPVLLLIGLATRFSALALLGMTLVIQIFVYPDAWPTHGTWAACLLMLMTRGPGLVSLDALIARRHP